MLGTKPPYQVMKGFLNRKWNGYGVTNICLLKSGVYIMEFEDNAARAKVMEYVPWYFDNKPVLVKPWSRC